MIRFSHFEFKEKQWASIDSLPFQLPRLQAHRGYWVAGSKQNTLDSVLAAHSNGYKMVELDLRLTKDGKIILFHDADVFHEDKVLPIRETNLEELQTLLPITTLDQLLSETPPDLFFNLEIKNESKVRFALEEKLVKLFKKHPASSRVLFSSFNPLSLSWFRQLIPDIPRAQLISQESADWNSIWLRELSFINLVQPHFLNLRWEDLDHYREIPTNRKVVWTVNDLEHAKTLFEYDKVASVISDSIRPQDLKEA